MSRNKVSQNTKNKTGGIAGLDKYEKQPHMIEIEKIVTFKIALGPRKTQQAWFRAMKLLLGMRLMVLYETKLMRRVNKFAAISTFNMTCTLHKNSIFYKKQKNIFEN